MVDCDEYLYEEQCKECKEYPCHISRGRKKTEENIPQDAPKLTNHDGKIVLLLVVILMIIIIYKLGVV